jgi:hypothetical protein
MKMPVLLRTLLLAALAVSLAGCDVLQSAYEQQIKPTLAQRMEDEVNEVIESAKDEVRQRIETLEPERFSCAADPALCPEITDPAMNSAWQQVTPAFTNQPGDRHLLYYLGVINQFRVASDYECRYRPYPDNGCAANTGSSDTRCNLFAGDVMRAMGAPLPTKGELGLGAAGSENSDPMTATAVHLNAWLLAGNGGWARIDTANPADLARLLAHLRDGKPALASRADHIAVIRPDQFIETLNTDNLGDLRIAQAGALNSNNTSLLKGFGSLDGVQIYIHE